MKQPHTDKTTRHGHRESKSEAKSKDSSRKMSAPTTPDTPTTDSPAVPPSQSKTSKSPSNPPPVTTSPVPPPPSTSSKNPDTPPTTSQAPPPPPDTTSQAPPPPPTTSSSSTPPPPPPTTSSPSSSPPPPPPETTSSSAEPSTTNKPPPTTSKKPTTSKGPVVTVKPTTPDATSTVVVTSHTTSTPTDDAATGTTSANPTPTINTVSAGHNGGLSQKSKVAIGVVVPIAAIAILAIVALFWWKKRRARKESAEERRKEVEDYAYNPNADPTIPAVGLANDNSYEMREDASSGYRGWGTTIAGSTGRKASTTMSGGVAGGAFSDITSPTRGNGSDVRSGDPLMDGQYSPEGEILGAMGPAAANNRHGDVHRGPSNASSSYSAAGRSDGSDNGMGMAYGSGGTYYDQYGQNPYQDNPQNGGQSHEMPGQPVIRDNPARRNTRIENGSHFPQQSAGIAQNF